MAAITSAASAICGTHFGDTKLVASIAGRPASVNRSMSPTLTAVGTSPGSFCNPSRGPTSTRHMRCGMCMRAKVEGVVKRQYAFAASTTPLTARPDSMRRILSAICATEAPICVTAEMCGVMVIAG